MSRPATLKESVAPSTSDTFKDTSFSVSRIERGVIRQNQEIAVCNYHDPDAAPMKAKATALYEFDGLAKVPVQEAAAGSIVEAVPCRPEQKSMGESSCSSVASRSSSSSRHSSMTS